MPDPGTGTATDTAVPDRVSTPLLTLLTEESLDRDYQHVAQNRAAAGEEPTKGQPRWVATAVVAVFGLLVTVAAVQTSNASGVTSANRASLVERIEGRRTAAAQLQGDLVRLRARNIGLEEDRREVAAQQRTVENRVDRLGALTGFGPATGPGLVITVEDAPNGEAVRDQDLQLLVNGLWEAGAEAISINGKRLTARSALRNAGAAINLNGPPPMSPPYVVSAIGNKGSLQANLLDTTTGLQFSNVADALGFPVDMENVDQLDLPAAPQRMLKPRWVGPLNTPSTPGKEPPS